MTYKEIKRSRGKEQEKMLDGLTKGLGVNLSNRCIERGGGSRCLEGHGHLHEKAGDQID